MGVYLLANSTRAVVCADIISFLAEPFRCWKSTSAFSITCDQYFWINNSQTQFEYSISCLTHEISWIKSRGPFTSALSYYECLYFKEIHLSENDEQIFFSKQGKSEQKNCSHLDMIC